jgi:hypothetical protein
MIYDMQNYLLSIPNDGVKGGIIHDPKSKLKVRVINRIKSTFTPKKGEVQYFVTAGKKTMAFETVGYQRHRQLLILQMIAWYCVYLGLLEAQIHSTLPL